ncbi:MAG: DUF6377 domain-containing protein [Alistipes sp.]|nr:DUF6377 domain-containing protein [Alistipes senegalensis]MCM1249872.1 DUF6377 domain-containing protein [Alistipes sp.]
MKPTAPLLRIALLSAVLLPASGASALPALDRALEELDRALDRADQYVAKHEVRVMTIENMLQSRGVSLEQQYEIYDQLYDEYVAFQFNKAMELLDKRAELADRIGDPQRRTDVLLDRAMLYTTSGMFLEANVVLNSTIDTATLTPRQRIAYHNTQHRFYFDFNEYTRTPEMNRISTAKIRYYRDRLLQEAPASSEIRQYMAIRDCMDRQEYAQADRLNRQLLSQFAPDSHPYAVHAYDQALIAEALDREDEKTLWYARSALADVRCATKDNASLCCLAQVMLNRQEINRAFRYITLSLNDALFYNAKLRPWQIANIIPMVEKSYLEMRAQQEGIARDYLIVISILATVLFGICIFVMRLYRRSQISRRKIESMNRQIQEYNASLSAVNEHTRDMNTALVESNAVKEEYIALFLSMCSNYIEKLTAYQRNVRNKLAKGRIAELQAESSSSSLMDAELQNFYEMFDNAFLQLYPDFVEEFNGLLVPSARIELKKGERLNTELRIFALIRLGITDSSRIASLLRYSVNTIYNYRARIKNNAAGSRDDFEKRIRTIGAMRSPEQP